jgi:hypothetical protein
MNEYKTSKHTKYSVDLCGRAKMILSAINVVEIMLRLLHTLLIQKGKIQKMEIFHYVPISFWSKICKHIILFILVLNHVHSLNVLILTVFYNCVSLDQSHMGPK